MSNHPHRHIHPEDALRARLARAERERDAAREAQCEARKGEGICREKGCDSPARRWHDEVWNWHRGPFCEAHEETRGEEWTFCEAEEGCTAWARTHSGHRDLCAAHGGEDYQP